MRSGFTTTQPVNPEPDPDQHVAFDVRIELRLSDLRELYVGLDGITNVADFFPGYWPLAIIGAQAYEAAKAQLGKRHVNGHDDNVNADLILPLHNAIEGASEDERDEIEALTYAEDVDGLIAKLGIDPSLVYDVAVN